MRKNLLLPLFLVAFSAIGTLGQNIELPAPALSDSTSLLLALENRCSTRQYDATKSLDMQEVSNLLWAGWGYNRDDKRTAPSALDRQEITLYVCFNSGTYRYDARNNTLVFVTSKNLMQVSGKQPFVEQAAINILYICNNNASTGANMSAVCCGAISQNIALYCATVGLGNVVRGSFDHRILQRELKLPKQMQVVLAQSIGYPDNTENE